MNYCPKCGGASTGAFCPQCGSPVTAQQPQVPASNTQGYPTHQPQQQAWPAQQQPYYRPPAPRKSNGLVIGLAVGGGVLVLGIVVLVLFASLGGSDPVTPPAASSQPNSNPTSNPSTAPGNAPNAAGKVARKPGYVTGIVLDERGAPLKVSPDQITIRVSGNRASDTQAMSGLAPVGPDGRFEMKVPDGTYSVTGFVKVTFQGTEFWLSLDPVGGNSPQAAKDGIVKEMRMKLTGLRPGQASSNPFSYYGGHVRIQYQGQTLPDDAQVTFTLTPTTPLADGSQGKPLTFTVTGKQLRSNVPLHDIPLAVYRISGEVTLPNGSKKKALISTAASQPATAQEVTFRPNATGEGIEATFLWMKGEQ